MTVSRRRQQTVAASPHQPKPNTHFGFRVLLVCAISIVIPGGCAETDNLELAPIRYGGAFGTSIRSRQFGEEDRTYTTRATAELNAASYIYEPWFARVATDLMLSWENEQREEEDSASSVVVSGSATFSILPESNYPTTITFSRTDTRNEGTFGNFDFVRDRVHVHSQAILPWQIRSSAVLSYDSIDQSAFGMETRAEATLNLYKTFTLDSLAASLSYVQSDFTTNTVEDEDSSLSLVSANVHWDSKPFEDVDVQSDSHLVFSNEVDGNVEEMRFFSQGLTTAFWRPDDFPFTVTGAFRSFGEFASTTNEGSGAEVNSQSQLISATLGINYPIAPRLNANFGLNGSYRTSDERSDGEGGVIGTNLESAFTAGIVGSVNYISLPEEISGFDWRWNAGAFADVEYTDEGELEDSESIDIGHSVDRSVDVPWLGLAFVNLSQRLNVSRSITEGTVIGTSHQASMTISEAEDGTSSFLRMSLLDDREFTGERPGNFQLAQILLSRQSTIDLERNWYADLSLQATRREDSRDEVDVFAAANGTVGYQDQMLFGVPDLYFNSEIVMSMSDFGSRLVGVNEEDDSNETFRAEWRNKLRYAIGRLHAELEGSFFTEGGELGNSMFLRVRRYFADDEGLF